MKNRVSFLLVCSFLFATSSFAQYDPARVNKKAVEAYEKGIEKAQDGKYNDAVESFREAIKRDGKYVDAYLSLAGVYAQMKNIDESIKSYEQAFAIDATYTSDYRLPYAINLARKGQFETALSEINGVLGRSNLGSNTRKAAEYRKKTFQFAIDWQKKHASENYVFSPQNLGDNINSAESEYFPWMSIDGSQFIFNRVVNDNRYRQEDFFGSVKKGGVWEKAVKLRGSINTPDNEGAQTVSPDGNWLIFAGCQRSDGFGSCDLYISYLTETGWSEAINLGKPVNTEQWDSQPTLSPDKRDLYFSSRRTGGLGGSDIYVSHLQSNGRWSEPENLGPEINTAGDEACPFIHADNQTLFFTSNTLPGYGQQDIFVTRKKPDGKWGKPENLGYPINTIDEEGTLFVAADGNTAFFASDRSDTKGGLDIYSFQMRPSMQPIKTLWVKGKVFDAKTKNGVPSSVELIDLGTGQTVSKLQTDETGNYLTTLPIGRDYAFNVNRKGYLFYSDNYSLKQKSADSTYQKDIPLQPIEVNASVVLRNIFFDFSKYELKPESQIELDKVVELLQQNPTVKIQIEGHTDNVGTSAENQKLSENRAKSVVNYLVSKGIQLARLSAKGFGATQPVAANTTDEGRAANRRTELKIVAR